MITKALKAFMNPSGHNSQKSDIFSFTLIKPRKEIIFSVILGLSLVVNGKACFAAIQPADTTADKAIQNSQTSPLGSSCDLTPFPGYEKSSQQLLSIKAASDFRRQAKMLIEMGTQDQKVRANFSKGEAVNWKAVDETDRNNSRAFKKMVEKEGLLSLSQVGGQAVAAEFRLIQHVRDIAFQKSLLEMMQKLFAHHDFPGDYVALLEDYLLVKDGKPQFFGTQIKKEGSLYPVIDKDQLDIRRASHGLPPYQKQSCSESLIDKKS
ncbi:DUF6624 domain-containing protein [Zymomonas mobilis]|uniref:Uncharacterized protein n=1 Tax=Zymomonas mobilis subsp. pomaceae (strain ATCC 29192 / DSM 22645 / JCM 10191 / CCUG 17912 / NBRC 13757 / NCIMB 11200 / NRRL B-4491 / Barker I) TaxID=579138 RepID=F8EW98_ZYMMT|nr:DUF6624 domain-containing protein [Zymomonas mobilis]AEI38508.1 hypothetical protein Zymop_1619 [Zymomonas mobilis subsp. pomaceae ATCC 29192]MDX5948197.1 DUF6624 domain-containing protein [Zymomonas mobilis subsp. pomaceae]